MKFSNTVIIALLLGVFPFVCGKTVRLLRSCHRKIEVDDDDMIYVKFDGSDWRFSSLLSCQVVFKAEDYGDNLNYDVTSFSNWENIETRVDGSHNGFSFNYLVSGSLLSSQSRRTTYRYLRITVRRRMTSQTNVKIKLKIYSNAYPGRFSNTSIHRHSTIYISVGAIIGIVVAVLTAVAIAIIVAICCCCRRRRGSRGTVMTPNAQATIESQDNSGYPASYPYQPGPNPYYGQGTPYTGQPGYPVQGYTSQPPPSYPGYPMTQPTTDNPPPPYPSYEEYKSEENKPM